MRNPAPVRVLIKKYGPTGTRVKEMETARAKLALPRVIPDPGPPAFVPEVKTEPSAEAPVAEAPVAEVPVAETAEAPVSEASAETVAEATEQAAGPAGDSEPTAG